MGSHPLASWRTLAVKTSITTPIIFRADDHNTSDSAKETHYQCCIKTANGRRSKETMGGSQRSEDRNRRAKEEDGESNYAPKWSSPWQASPML
jgi:hypothetical protein